MPEPPTDQPAGAPWSTDQLEHIGTAEELQLGSRRRDGTLRPYVTMWAVRVGDQLYVRSAYEPDNPWYRRATASRTDRIRAGGVEHDGTFTRADDAMQGHVGTAYHAKHDHHGPRIVDPNAHPHTVRHVSRTDLHGPARRTRPCRPSL